jgi:hypothetical protein
MPECRRHLFSPKVHEEFVGEILYRRRGEAETDHDLYLDNDTHTFFVVGSESLRTGPVLNNTHTRYTLDEYLSRHPTNRERTADMLAARVKRGTPNLS